MRLMLSYRCDAGVVGQHESADPVRGLAVGRLAGEGHLETKGDTGGDKHHIKFKI